jgi:glutamine amidotransferase
MQLIFDHSEEDGGVDCLGLLPGRVEKLRGHEDDGSKVPVPHMGWNPSILANDPLFAKIDDQTPFYYVHSFRCVPGPAVNVIARCHHGEDICAGVRHGSLAAVQFHPEKSGEPGLQLLRNFFAANQ